MGFTTTHHNIISEQAPLMKVPLFNGSFQGFSWNNDILFECHHCHFKHSFLKSFCRWKSLFWLNALFAFRDRFYIDLFNRALNMNSKEFDVWYRLVNDDLEQYNGGYISVLRRPYSVFRLPHTLARIFISGSTIRCMGLFERDLSPFRTTGKSWPAKIPDRILIVVPELPR